MSVALPADLSEALGEALGGQVERAHPLAGGDINEAYAVTLSDGRRAFVKTHPRAPAGMFAAEAEGLAWLAEAKALRVPEVLACADGSAAFLALELLESGPKATDFDTRLGQGLAALHLAHPPHFGWHRDNFIGSLPQTNAPTSSWTDFFAQQRLEPQLKLAQDAGRLSPELQAGFRKLLSRLDALSGKPEPPARLHGDLWGGNLHVDAAGLPCLIDPAVYGGHREMDLAMMQLFGGFGPQVFRSYDAVFPRAPGHQARVPLYQLYPLLVHLNLFGAGYAGSVQRALDAALRG